MNGSNEEIQFSWGRRRAKGGQKMDTKFYESFIFDNVKYSLYDCVYLFKTGDPVPYIGKIVKIWEQNQAKKVKLLWFFLPDEIQQYLRDPVMEKEIFLASGGEGNPIGLADVNPLEAIAGKCTVICISKDERNRQPSDMEVAIADYIFYRFFNVENCTISDQVPDKIAGLEVNVLLNPKVEQAISVPVAANIEEDVVATIPHEKSLVKKEDESLVSAAPLSQSEVKENENRVANLPKPVVKEEDQKPVTSISLPLLVDKEDKGHVASDPSPRSAAMGKSVAKHTRFASPLERPPKKLKSSHENSVQNMGSTGPDKRHSKVTSIQTDKSKWFKFVWEDELDKADKQGRLVYIQNLDIQFGGDEIKDLIHKALQLNCSARPINHPTYDDPNNGKAYAIFKNKSDADIAISRINSGLIVGGRPLYCSKGLLKIPPPSGTLVGHLSIYDVKIGQKQREEQKKAVSTSHCSQPNTIEYDLALDWMLTREKQDTKFRTLHMRHKEERRKFESIASKNAKTGK